MNMETFIGKDTPHGDFITLALMHIKAEHNEEAEKVMRSTIKAKRYDDAKTIGGLLDASRK